MAKKILFCASTISHIRNFHLPYLEAFHSLGYEVHVACDRALPIPFADHVFSLPFQKSFLSPKNIQAISSAKTLLQKENYDIISLHTTLASVIMRLGIWGIKNRPYVVQTVHGYLFSKSDSIIKKLIYLLPEKLCAPVTNITMVMNQEDYTLAESFRLFGEKLYFIHGMGIDCSRFYPRREKVRLSMRKQYGFSADDFLFVYAAEFSKRKNQSFLLDAFCHIAERYPKAHLLLAGQGKHFCACKMQAQKSSYKERIHFLGQVKDMENFYQACDVCVTTSKSEGLPFAVMEAMGCGVPVVASDIKGHRDLIRHEHTGLLYPSGDLEKLCACMQIMIENPFYRERFSALAKESLKSYAMDPVKQEIMNIYHENIPLLQQSGQLGGTYGNK